MIGVILTTRRHEFLNFACENVIEYEEILDTENRDDLIRFDKIFSDAPTELVGAFPVKCFGTEPLAEVFKEHILGAPNTVQKSYSSCLYAFDYFHRFLLKGFVPAHFVLDLSSDVKAEPEAPQIKQIELTHINKVSEPEFDESNITDIPDTLEVAAEALEPVVEVAVPEPQIQHSDVQPQNLFSSLTPQMPTESVYAPPPQQIPQPQYTSPPQPQYIPPQQQTFFQQPAYTPPPPPVMQQPVYSEQATSFFGQADNMPVVAQPHNTAIRGRAQVGSVRPKGMKSKAKQFQVPIITLSAITDKTGVSSVAYLLAHTLAGQHPAAKILYIDLNISNPNSILNTLGLNPDTDAAITNIAKLSQDDFINNIALLTEVVGLDMGRTSISLITFGQATFAQKRWAANANFEQLLATLANNFDLIIVDMGKIQSTLNYQLNLLNSHVARHILLADGSDSRMIRTFVSGAQELPRNFEIIINKYTPQSGVFTINQTLHMQPIANIGLHRNVEAHLVGRLPLDGTTLLTELSRLGGIL